MGSRSVARLVLDWREATTAISEALGKGPKASFHLYLGSSVDYIVVDNVVMLINNN